MQSLKGGLARKFYGLAGEVTDESYILFKA